MKSFPRELRHGSGAMMMLDPTRLLLAFKEATALNEVEAGLKDFGLALEDAQDIEREKRSHPFDVINHTDRRFWVRSQMGQPIDQERFDALQNKLADVLDWIGPVYRLGDVSARGGLLCPLNNWAPIGREIGQAARAVKQRNCPIGVTVHAHPSLNVMTTVLVCRNL